MSACRLFSFFGSTPNLAPRAVAIIAVVTDSGGILSHRFEIASIRGIVISSSMYSQVQPKASIRVA